MFYQFRIFLVEPENVFVYSLENDREEAFPYDVSLNKYSGTIHGFKYVDGYVTAEFKVTPIIVQYANGEYQIVYAPKDSPYVYTYDGQPALHNCEKIISKTFVLIPDIDRSEIGRSSLSEIPLENYSETSFHNFYTLSHHGKEQDTNLSYLEYKQKPTSPFIQELSHTPSSQSSHSVPPSPSSQSTPSTPENVEDEEPPTLTIPTEPPKTPRINIPTISQPTLSPENLDTPLNSSQNFRSPSPRTPIRSSPSNSFSESPSMDLSSIKNELSELRQKFKESQAEISELKHLVKAVNQRLYQIYPIHLPPAMKTEKGETGEIITVPEIQKKIAEGQVERFELDPMLQPYAGSHDRNNNRYLTFYGKDGKIYFVRASYNMKNNKFNEPK